MSSLEKILQDGSEFLHKTEEIATKWRLELKEECCKDLVGYHPLEGGHMLRPLLVYLTSSAFEKQLTEAKKEKLCYFAAAVELMHNASLIHDDLLDKEEFRRGKLSLYKKYDFKNALLAGNIYYIKAIALSNQYLDIRQTADLLHCAVAMCEGEILQAKYENMQIPTEVYRKIIKYKTGSLTSLACKQAGVIMQTDENIINALGRMGEELGIMYQLRDDRKDQDANLDSDYSYEDQINLCEGKIVSLMETLSKELKTEGFKEVVEYFKK